MHSAMNEQTMTGLWMSLSQDWHLAAQLVWASWNFRIAGPFEVIRYVIITTDRCVID